MIVSFNIKYDTVWGERLYIVGSCMKLGADNNSAAKEMHCYGNGEWQLEMSFPCTTKEIKYRYFVEDINGVRKPESGNSIHHISLDKNCSFYILYDYWLSEQGDKTFYTSAFTKNLFARCGKKTEQRNKNSTGKNNFSLRLTAPQIKPDQAIVVTGNQFCLGNWNPENAPHLSAIDFPNWEIQLKTDDLRFPLEYKFVIIDNKIKKSYSWEEGNNRIINNPVEKDDSHIIVNNYPFKNPYFSWKACGTVIPVFSLRSNESFGIGDFGDIKKLIDWAKKTGQHIIQVLPMNDTTRSHSWKDSYPYSAISIYALHPLYINFPMLGGLNDKVRAAHYIRIQKKLNAKKSLDYQSVEKYKTEYLREYFDQEKENILNNNDFKEFIAKNRDWLIPYAAFSYLRDKNNTADFYKWGEYAIYNREKTEKFCHPESVAYNEFSYIFFIQHTLYEQFKSASDYARKNNIILKGDIPIGVNRESVEAWTEPDFFNMQEQTGAPPDDFSETGQNWSFPTYNWEVMEKDGFEWWKKRFRKLNNYFESFRIDHILGFFRIWEIPNEYTEGLCGHFRPAMPLTEKEIGEYGMAFDNRWTIPRINIRFLPEIFGDIPEKDIFKYFSYTDAEHLILNEFCSTQKKIIKLFKNEKDIKSQKIKNGLMNIANEVLFLKDPYNSHCYHPRISSYKSYLYRELTDENRQSFDKLYNDFFFVRHNSFWKETALKRLTPLINSTDMLVCGEDLGMIPESVHEVMSKLQIFTLELERAPKIFDCEFSDLTKLPYHSVCTTSTHDMSTIRVWWKEDRNKTQRYYNSIMHKEGCAPEECSAKIAGEIILNHLKASSMLTIIPMQDWFALDDSIKRSNANAERINIPANPDNYWCYRIHISLEKLLLADNFNKKIRSMIVESGRK